MRKLFDKEDEILVRNLVVGSLWKLMSEKDNGGGGVKLVKVGAEGIIMNRRCPRFDFEGGIN